MSPEPQAAHAIEQILSEQLRRVRRRFLIHGLGWMLAAACGCALLYYPLDRLLQLPAGVRLIVTLAAVAYLLSGLRRRVLYPLRAEFGRSDVALALERRFPELEQRLISAHQLDQARSRGELRGQSDSMVARLVAETDRDLRRLPVDQLLNPVRTRRVWVAAAGLLAVGLFVTATQPIHVWTTLQRALGLNVDYPKLTLLHVELPLDDPDFQIEVDGDRALITLAAGADLPVLVRAEGIVPREVFLAIDGGRGMAPEISMTRRPGDRFRHVFRQLQGDFSFHARGGDDPDGDLEVEVRTVRPPLVAEIETALQFPAYTGRADESFVGGTIEALIGTRVRLRVTATLAVEQAAMLFLESGAELPLEPLAPEDDSGEQRHFEASFVIEGSDRYEIRLLSPDGLRNPKPGTYPIVAVEDHPPVGRVLLPSSDDIHVVMPQAFIPLRVEAKDDFGLARIDVHTRSGKQEIERSEALITAADAAARTRIGVALLPLDALTPGREIGPEIGETIDLQVWLQDNRQPEAQRVELAPRQVHVVAESDLLRRISGQFRRLREEVETTLSLQRDRRQALEELIADPPAGTARDPRLVAIEVGQGRVASSALRIREGLMQSYDTHLFNRLEGSDSAHAQRVIELYLQVQRDSELAEPRLPAFYRQVAEAQQAGKIGALDKTLDPILSMVLAADRIVEQHGSTALAALDAAGLAEAASQMTTQLRSAVADQQNIERELEALLSRLDEWNEFQDLIHQARALRDAQRDVESRTRGIRGGDR